MGGYALWWWGIGIVILALVLLLVGRAASRASVAGSLPRDEGPDLKASETGQEPDIPPDDRSSA